MLGEIKFNGYSSYSDLRFSISNIEVGFPEPNQILEKIPFSSNYLDFSYMSGQMQYNLREISVVFKLKKYTQSTEVLNATYLSLINALTTKDMRRLEISFLDGYFVGRISNYSSLNLMLEENEIQVVFSCMPYRYTDRLCGQEAWDTFNFITDIMQDTQFTVNKLKNVTLYNAGVTLAEVSINASNTFKITHNDNIYDIKKGLNKNVFKLDLGENEVKIEGTGSIDFQFYKEVL